MLVTIRPSGKSQGNVCSSTLPTKLQSNGACILSPSLRRRGLGGGERLRKPAWKEIPLLYLLLAGFVCPASAASADTITKQVAPGIVYTQEITTGASPLIVNILRIELSAPGVHVRCGQALDAITLRAPTLGRETIPSLARRSHAVAGVNADFFPFTGDPLGLAVRDGELLSEPADYRACLGIGKSGVRMDVLVPIGTITASDKSESALLGINRLPHANDTVVLTPSYAATPPVDKEGIVVTLRRANLPVHLSADCSGTIETVAPIAAGDRLPPCPSDGALIVALGASAARLQSQCRQGEALTFRFDLVANTPAPVRGRYPSRAGGLRNARFSPRWMDVEQAVGGGPFLVRDGLISVDGEAENFPSASFINKRHPRTAAGVDASGKLLLVTVDGRAEWSCGVSLPELAAIMKRLGAVNAINFDGGGSTTMFLGDGIVNAPSDGEPRAVADGLFVYSDDINGSQGNVVLQPAQPTASAASDAAALTAGRPTQLHLPAESQETQMPVAAETTAPVEPTDSPLAPDAVPVNTAGRNDVLWATENGYGFVSQTGVFTALHAGTGYVVARRGTSHYRLQVRVNGGSAAVVRGALTTRAGYPQERNVLTITVTDRYGNPVFGQKVTIESAHGEATQQLVTDMHGRATSDIFWDGPASQRTLVALAGNVRSAIIRGDAVKPTAPPKAVPIDPDDR